MKAESAEDVQDTRFVKKRPEIVQVLKLVRDQCANVSVRIENDPELYTCRLLDVADDHFVIDDISPRHGLSAIKSAKSFTVSARSSGNFLYIENCKVSSADDVRGIPFFHVNLPKQILINQRRRDDRYHLPLSVIANGGTAEMRMAEQDETALSGDIIDISVGGCKVDFKLPTQLSIAKDAQFPVCNIRVNDRLEVRAQSIVRHMTKDLRNNSVVCGFEFLKMDVSDRRHLEKFVRKLAKTVVTQ